MKVVFFGSGPFGLPALESLCSRTEDVEMVLVVSRPDKPRGRGRRAAPTPLRERAMELGIPSEAPETANDAGLLDALEAHRPDLSVVVDYGEMLRKRIREIPRIGTFNLHASLLPRYRGAAPVARALLDGAARTGVTLFRIEKGLDSGPIVDAEEVSVDPLETTRELEERLSHVAARLLERNLSAFAGGTFREAPQDDEEASYAPKLEKSMGLIDWEVSPRELTDRIRALNPWPLAWSYLELEGSPAERTSFLRVRPRATDAASVLAPGTVEAVDKGGFRVRCRGGSVEVLELQREGKKALDATSYLRGRPLRAGYVFGNPHRK